MNPKIYDFVSFETYYFPIYSVVTLFTPELKRKITLRDLKQIYIFYFYREIKKGKFFAIHLCEFMFEKKY